ncbi:MULTISPECIES: DUF4401 domain-containing protein [unclassified Chryseobacterium]|uniref:DUF4401 domain-containing protein n=1 Tax=unclassified Chryseobacterium TaxID=2593645 RepID=UPI00100AB6B7|nr:MULTISPECIES: DUF4401 domain-containing protein [unclassified Chryseobacterium]RXM52550.1 hypothetical protein BOQ64_06725 [Chryseobacterium sp. CH25]RXM66607.1 hypothetical protein BOQ60_01200 [Chryseobacterium sp. CH1]
MRNKENIKELMDHLHTVDGREIHFDEEAITAAYEEKNINHQSLAIKILSIFGGIMACLAFLGFIFMVQVLDSQIGAGIFGVLCITGSSFISKISGKTIVDTLSVSFFITGFSLLGMALYTEGDTIYPVFIALALSVLFLVQSYILSFISVLIINGSILAFAEIHHAFALTCAVIILQAVIITFLFLSESKIITKSKMLSKLYDPVRTGMVFSFIFTLTVFGFKSFFRVEDGAYYYGLIPSVAIVIAILYVISHLFRTVQVTDTTYKILMYVLTVLFLLPTVLTPTIPGAILIILLSFLVNYKTGFVLAVIALICFIGRFYYDLNFTLLTKSILLFTSGIIFLAIYFFTHKKLTAHEKI